MEYLLLALLAIGIPIVLPIASWIYARGTRARLERLEALIEEQADRIRRLERAGVTPPPAAARPIEPAAVVAPPPPQPPKPVEPPRPIATPTPVEPPRPVEVPRPVPMPPPVAAAKPPVSPRPTLPPRAPEPPAPDAPAFDWESLIGVKLFSAIAGVALVVAAIFFLRYSIEHGWLQPPLRVAIGVAVAIALLVICELKAARRYPVTANAMDAAAIAILFSTFFAAHALWHLVPAGVAFALLAIVTAVAVLLSIRRASLFIAVLGLLGGFATPALLSSGQNQPIPLFAYLVLLNVGLAWVAYRQRWPMLTVLTLVLTTVYQWGWVLKFLDTSQLTLAMGIFLIFPVLGVAALVLARTSPDDDGDRTFERAALVAAGTPLLFAAYLAAVPAYGAHPWLLFGFLLLVDAGLLAIAIARRQELLHGAGALATLAVMATWLARSFTLGEGLAPLAAAAALVVFFSIAPALARAFGRPFEGPGSAASYAAPLLLFVPAVLARLEPAFAAPLVLFGVTLALVLVIAWRAIAEERGALYFLAAFFAVAVQASWSATHLTIETLRAGVTAYAVFGAAAIGMPPLARRLGRSLEPVEGPGLVLLASLGLLLFLSFGRIAPEALWALALLLAILNAGLYIESAASRLPALAMVGSVASWFVLATWWYRAAAAVGVLSSLFVVAGLSLVTLGGHAWAHVRTRGDRAQAAPDGSFSNGLFLGLGGHLFLLFVAINRAWSLPPWPWMAVLGVVTLGASAASLLTGAARLHAAAAIAAAIVIAAWTATAGAGWTTTAVVASFVASAYALAWLSVVRRRKEAIGDAAGGAAVVLFVGEATAVVAVATAPPPFSLIVTAHVANLGLILALTAWRRWPHVASLAVVPAVAAAAVQTGGAGQLEANWAKVLLLSFAMYAVFISYPLGLARRARRAKDPYVAAVLASALFFFAGKAALDAGGFRWMVGALPVFEGAVMALLLRHLLALEPAGQRDMGRLALVGGATLAFVTVAIPLQLRHQWITIGWALEAAALAWLYGRVRHRGLLATAAALFTAVFVRLAVNPEVFRYEPRGAMRILNWYLYTYVVCAVAFLFGAWRLSREPERDGLATTLVRALPAAAVVLLFLLLNIEIADFYATGPAIVFRFGVTVSQDLTYTIGWLGFGMVLLGACIYLRSHAGRVAALALIAVTTFKCFLYDLRSLEGLYRVGSFVGLATALALVSIALQKWVLVRPERPQ